MKQLSTQELINALNDYDRCDPDALMDQAEAKIVELRDEVVCYAAMREGVQQRIADLEKELEKEKQNSLQLAFLLRKFVTGEVTGSVFNTWRSRAISVLTGMGYEIER